MDYDFKATIGPVSLCIGVAVLSMVSDDSDRSLQKLQIQYKYKRILLFTINAYNENVPFGSLEFHNKKNK